MPHSQDRIKEHWARLEHILCKENTCRTIVIMKPTNGQINKQARQKRELCDSVQVRTSFVWYQHTHVSFDVHTHIAHTRTHTQQIYLFDQKARHLHACFIAQTMPLQNTHEEKSLWFFPSSQENKRTQYTVRTNVLHTTTVLVLRNAIQFPQAHFLSSQSQEIPF